MDVYLHVSGGVYSSECLVELEEQNFVLEKLHHSFRSIMYLYLCCKSHLKFNYHETNTTYNFCNSDHIQKIHIERSMEPGQCGDH